MPASNLKTPLGYARITEEDGYITSISIGDEEHDVDTVVESPILRRAMLQLTEYFEGKRMVFDLPVKQHGTAFQQKVWEQLTKVDYGSAISYLQQSKLMNNPLGIRAIAAANGKNKLWIVVPCHRIIGSDGGLTGYAGGLWRKKWLLEHEARIMGKGQTKLDL